MYKKVLNELLYYIIAGIVVWSCILLIFQSDRIHEEIIDSIERCVNVIIPSLFAFMVVSDFIINSGIYIYITKPFYLITKYIIKMPNSLFFVFLLGNIAGYPVGAKLLSDMVKKGVVNKKTAEVANTFCYNGGAAFFSGTIGLAVYKNINVGMLVFLSVILSNFIIACIMCRVFALKCGKSNERVRISADYITESVVSAGKSLFIICVTIIFFSCVFVILDAQGIFVLLRNSGFSENSCTLIKSFFEISYITNLSKNTINLIPIISGLCSFGGICVLMQVKAIIKNTYSLKLFIALRFVSSIISAFICRLLFKWFAPFVMPVVSDKAIITIVPNNFIPTICLIFMIFIVAFTDKRIKNKKSCSHN